MAIRVDTNGDAIFDKELNDPTVSLAQITDLTADGKLDVDLRVQTATAVINGATFGSGIINSGTGGFNDFLGLQHNPTEFGFNSAVTNDPSNPYLKTSTNFTHTIKLSDLAITTINGVQYYDFRLDVNESNSTPTTQQISLDSFKLYSSTDGTIGTLAALQALTPDYDLDAGGGINDVSVLFTDAYSSGSGRSDLSVLVPVSAFGGKDPATTYLYLYSAFGFASADYNTDATFEEWRTQNAVVLHGTKFSDINSDGIKNGSDPFVGGVTVKLFEDTNHNGVLDAGDVELQSTVTDANGNYTFYGVKTNGTYFVDEVNPAGSTQTTGAYETVIVAANATVGSTIQVDPIGNHYPVPHILIDKAFVNITDGPDGGNTTGSTTVIDGAGDVANYTIDIRNDGETALTNVVVTDTLANAGAVAVFKAGGFNSGDTNSNNVLDTGEIWHYTATQTATQADLDTNGGGDSDKDNSATVVATQQGTANTVTATDTAAAPVVQAPSIAITKVFNGWSGGDGDNIGDFAGDIASYTIVVTNTGNVTLTNVVVTDPLTGNVYNVGTLLPGVASAALSETYTLTQADLNSNGTVEANSFFSGSIENTATATSRQTGPASASAVAPLVYNPAIDVAKSVTSITGGVGGQADSAGDTINYAISIANTGNISLTGVTVTDKVESLGATTATYVSGDTDSDGVLDVGETWNYTANYVVTQADLDGKGGGDGDIDNLATGDTTQTDPDTATAAALLVYNPSVDLEKLVSKTGGADLANYIDADTAAAGYQNVGVQQDMYFAITAKNTGNVTLTDVVITDVSTAYGGSTKTLFSAGSLTADALALGATLSGDTDSDGKLDVGETWTILYKQGYEFGQHVNTASITDAQNATDTDLAYYYGIQTGPGVRTPGFWSNLGGQFWDNIVGNETKSGPTFAKGELLYAVDSNNDGLIDGNDKVGLLVGDFNHNGKTDAGEDTLFIGLSDAKNLINSSLKTQSGDGVQKLGRDVVATWLNFLADNPIGDASDTASPKHFIQDAVNWLQTWGGKDGVNSPGNLADNVKTETFDVYDPAHTAVKTSTAQWNVSQFAGDNHSGSQMHSALDYYNNTGQTSPTSIHYAMSADIAADVTLIMASQAIV